MPVRGRPPKPDGQAVNRNPKTHSWVEVPDLPYKGRRPKLPRRADGAWSARAKRKWQVWSTMPHCRLWTDGDWEYALDSLEVFERFHRGDRAAAKELRDREKVMGTTLDYLRALRIRYVDPDGQDQADEQRETGRRAEVKRLDDYRDAFG